jgi:nickel-dependent lactate racemase
MLAAQAIASPGTLLDEETIRTTLHAGLDGRFTGAKVLVLIPDHTRTLPLPALFRLAVEVLADTHQLDFMVALGTHPSLDDASLLKLVGITAEERTTTYRHIGLLNHTWDDPDALTEIGILPRSQVQQIAGDAWHPSLGGDVPVRINRAVLDYDHIIILGPTFPHEVVGFSGGAKYLFPGISGGEMINATHWLGALIGIVDMIGIADTPVRTMIHAAAAHLPTPVSLISLVIEQQAVSGMFIGDYEPAWQAAAALSAERHIIWVDKPYQRVLSFTPPMYDELWTGAKAMYKLEPAIADGGEVIVYAPHLDVVSHVHGKYIYEIGYHVRDYFLKQWERFKHIPLGVLAHSTHLRGGGTYANGIEQGRIGVTLSSKISAEDCARLALDYLNPDAVDIRAWQHREDEGILFVPKAGEMLYRVKPADT